MAVGCYNIYISNMEMFVMTLSFPSMFPRIMFDSSTKITLLNIFRVSKPVKLAFFFHLTHWLLFGTIDDQHSEFFIRFKKSVESSSKNIDKSSASNNTNLVINIHFIEMTSKTIC